MRKAVFLDKDGTLIKNIPYNIEPSLIELTDNAIPGLKKMLHNEFLLILISNQSGIALGYFTELQLKVANNRIKHILKENEIRLDGIYYCPHHPEGKVEEYRKLCTCRKPFPGLIKQAAVDFELDLSQSWMVGDILDDIEAGKRAGCKTILIKNGNETEWKYNEWRHPDYEASDLMEASHFISIDNKILA